ncbi:serine/arginine-rich splicing factor 4-like [Uloborus diversus]|uniref:serine/arginine-rich splicing factor 4-like n=1 Tax=Uloborus diversus TaxID=327109 RepID=UPI0024095DD8|nr:serine/arginine-rich splicing factor 4-like [Uloborus diversus]
MSSRAQLFVGRLPIDIRERDVEQVFEKYGRLLRCDVKYGMYGSTGRRSSGRTGMAYAFVDYDDRRDAEDAIKYENGREIRGQSIVVEWARGPSYRSGGGGRENYGRPARQNSEECYRCRRTGHWARDCPELERDRYYPRARQRSRSRSRSRSYRKRRSPSHSRSRSGDRRRRSDSGYRQKSRSVSRDKRVKQRSPSASVSPARSPSRSRSRSHGKSRRKAEKSAKKSKRVPSKSPTRSRSISKSVSRSPPMKRKVKSLSGSPENDYVDKHNSVGHYEKNRSISPSPRKESFRSDNYRSISRSKSR